MEPLLYVMAIMGCADGGSLCQEQRIVERRYASQSACQQDSSAQLMANSDLSYPTIMAACRSVSSRWASNQAGQPSAR